jgi:hypothetical protein
LRLFIIGFFLILAAPSNAATTLYECRFSGVSDGWMPEQLVLADDGDGRVKVSDTIIETYAGGPVEAKVADCTKVRTTYSWSVRVKDVRNNTFKMAYRLSIFSNGQPAQLSAQPLGFDNRYTTSGTCTSRAG